MASRKPLVLTTTGVQEIASTDSIPVTAGGTGGTTIATALANLHAQPVRPHSWNGAAPCP